MTAPQPSASGRLFVATVADTANQTETGDSRQPCLVVDLIGEDPRLELVPQPMLGSDDGLLGAPRFSLRAKRAIDVIGAIIGLLVVSPILFVALVSVALTSPGSPVFKQRRVGRDGREFDFYKFRSMRVSAEQELSELVDQNEVDGPIFKIRHDPRITSVGRFLRRSSIDELPQLWNVLRGDMSLVGPRPPLPDEVAQYSDWERQRLLVTPGITCIWQVSGRSSLDFETWVCMDLQYISAWRPWLDFVLMAKTVPAVLSGRGAY